MLERDAVIGRISAETAQATIDRLRDDLRWYVEEADGAYYVDKGANALAVHRDLLGHVVRDAVRQGLPAAKILRAALNAERVRGGFSDVTGDDQHRQVAYLVASCDVAERLPDRVSGTDTSDWLYAAGSEESTDAIDAAALLQSHLQIVQQLDLAPAVMDERYDPVLRQWTGWTSRALTGLPALTTGLSPFHGRAASVLRRLCERFVSEAAVSPVPDLWHPAAGRHSQLADDWARLCELAAQIADRAPEYGVPVSPPRRSFIAAMFRAFGAGRATPASRPRPEQPRRRMPAADPAEPNPSWVQHAYPLQQLTVHVQGTVHTRRSGLVAQLTQVAGRLMDGDDSGEEHDDDFGYRFEFDPAARAPSFFEEGSGLR